MPKTQYASLPHRDIKLAYEEFGKPSDPALLLIHGLNTQRIGWPDVFCQSIADQGFRVIRFDNRDIGQSTKCTHLGRANIPWMMLLRTLGLPAKSPYQIQDMVEDTKGLLDYLDIKAAHIAGASMGGMIAQLFASLLPNRTLSLISIMSTSGKRGLPGPTTEVKKHLFSSPKDKSEAGIIEHEMKFWRLISSQTLKPSEEALSRFITESVNRDYPNRGGAERQFAAILNNGSRVKHLKHIKAPTLVIHGNQDPLIPPEGGIDTAKHIPKAKLALIDHMGHDIPTPLIEQLSGLISNHCHESLKLVS
ncbi:alpha/beta hydrolase [Maricurvus nonylphenolicus]|uniref:alpha/beta fold hydrolase n=1 Tax=Maricurvus nonylphenolicus TaxID=1008307 RepID=UPI0036F261CF